MARIQGGGHVYRRADGRWEAKVSLGRDPITGKRSRRSIYGDTPEAVDAELTRLKYQRDRGLPVRADRLTVARYLETWLEETVRPAARPATHARYRRAVEHHIAPGIGHIRLVKLTPDDVQRLLNALGERGRLPRHQNEAEATGARAMPAGLAPRSVLLVRAVLRRALTQAMRRELIARNVATLIDPPPAGRYEGRWLDDGEARALLTAAAGSRLDGLVTIALCLGLRQGETLGLAWEDIDLAAGVLRVRRQLQRVDGEPRLVELKTARSRRTLPLPAAVAAALRAQRARQACDRMLAGGRWREWGLVFTTTVGTPWSPRNLTRDFHALLAEAGLPPLHWHGLRHSAGSLLHARGVDLVTIKEILGHSQIGMTANLYTHVAAATTRQAADLMDAIVAPRGADGRQGGRQTG